MQFFFIIHLWIGLTHKAMALSVLPSLTIVNLKTNSIKTDMSQIV